ncbi:hypothetical protein MRB53_021976 [Persea americana]|uniref:Uncharacterized protein n=1 Tax=Persea americana TaxID=3435 RepID=A0ACC2L5L7_PERAE|nr:hypothetical protein MRB53_021976 [Persea americana]
MLAFSDRNKLLTSHFGLCCHCEVLLDNYLILTAADQKLAAAAIEHGQPSPPLLFLPFLSLGRTEGGNGERPHCCRKCGIKAANTLVFKPVHLYKS